MEVVRLENRPEGAKFEDVRELVSGARGKTVYETGDLDAGIWSAGITVGLIHDIVSSHPPPFSPSFFLMERFGTDDNSIVSGLVAFLQGSLCKHREGCRETH